MKFLIAALALALAVPAAAEVQVQVDRSELKAYIYHDQRLIDTYPVAMGKPGSETPLGTFTVTSIDFNPDWQGTRGQGYVPSGPNNPLGRVRLRYDPPYALHGTNNPLSIGTYASLGCIRMHNDNVIDLARTILIDTESWQGEAWFNSMLRNPRQQYRVLLKQPATITIVE